MQIRIFIISVFFIFTTLIVKAQTKIPLDEALVLKENIIKKSKSTITIINDFTQYTHLSFLSKDIISKGKLVFKSPNLIKWEYVKPYKNSVILKKNKLYVNDDGTKSEIDLSSNKTFKEMNSLLLKSVKGNMFDDEKFEIAFFKKVENYMVSFIPLDKSMKSFINKFELTFNSNSFNVIEIKMIELSEDYTTIKFSNTKINEPVANEVFEN
tara:strand:- start:601 stop:1233 length:633 start_codon:yes stop_codon:yes gene_type:complete